MYSTEAQARNGFKTFIITLMVSLVLFGGLYYLLTGFSEGIDIEADSLSQMQEDTSPVEQTTTNTTTTDNTSEVVAYNKTPAVQGTTTSVFQQIEKKPVTAKPAYVLAGSTSQTTESSVPSTGSNTLFGVALSVFSFSAALFVIAFGPRKIAMTEFEKEMTSL